MKKRIALAASIALAISVGGMLPASAAKLGAPTLAGTSCARANGQVEVKAYDGNVNVSVTATDLVVSLVGAAAGTGLALTDCTTPLAGLLGVSIKATEEVDSDAEGNVTIDLEGPTAGLPSNYGNIPMSIQAENVFRFNGTDLGAFYGAAGTITEEGFTIGSVTGVYFAGGVTFSGGAGSDVIDASSVATTVLTMAGGNGDDTLKGGALGDTITGGEDEDVLYGNGGNDILNSADTETCGYGSPSGNAKARQKNYCTVTSPSGIDEAWGGVGNDTITSGTSDTVAPGDGNDIITNAAALVYADSTAAISLDLRAGKVVKSTAGNDTWSGSVSEFVGSPFADTMIGAGTSDDAFYGGDGADALVGLAGADFLSGNGGTDVIKGGEDDDEIYGDTGADKINGGADNDHIYMGGGDDIAYGSTGDDVLRGQKGSDQAWGGRGTFDVCAAEVTDSCEFKK